MGTPPDSNPQAGLEVTAYNSPPTRSYSRNKSGIALRLIRYIGLNVPLD
jgi:hypothetical protein